MELLSHTKKVNVPPSLSESSSVANEYRILAINRGIEINLA